MTEAEQRAAATKFYNDWRGIGDEKSDSQRFWIEFFSKVLGIENVTQKIIFEKRVVVDGQTKFIDVYIPETRVLIEQKSIDKELDRKIQQSDGSMRTPFEQARNYAQWMIPNETPLWIVACNFRSFEIHDMNKPNENPVVIRLEELRSKLPLLGFMFQKEVKELSHEMEISFRAGEIVGILYDKFEELENNLHPALQRRLFDYLYNYAILKDTRIFITTHSHVAINAFFGRDDTRIYHVIKENGRAEIKKIDTFIDKVEILDDLDVKASDILQSNGIVWVEGPSDRIYIKRWLEVFTENAFIEGKDYQFLYYGGKTLANYSLEENPQLINILTTNHNAAIIMDSDKRNRQSKLNDTKKRVIEGFDKLGMLCWVTKGKEIENYISCDAISKALGKTLKKQCGQYQLFPDYIKIYCKSFSNQKVAFSKKVSPYIDGDNAEILDIKKQITALYNEMRKWNK